MARSAEKTILAFDTSAAHCAAAVLRGSDILCEFLEPMKRGQAERLMGLITETLDAAKVDWKDLDVIAVGTGPGNFTGIRISVAAARGLALSLNIPAVGVSNFCAIAELTEGAALAAVPAPRDQLYVQQIHTAECQAPYLTTRAEAEAGTLPIALLPEDFNPAVAMARAAHARPLHDQQSPTPLYIKAADAAPARDLPPKVIP